MSLLTTLDFAQKKGEGWDSIRVNRAGARQLLFLAFFLLLLLASDSGFEGGVYV